MHTDPFRLLPLLAAEPVCFGGGHPDRDGRTSASGSSLSVSPPVVLSASESAGHWVWEHFYEGVEIEDPPDYYGNDTFAAILTRPENVMAVGRVGLDLMRLAPDVYKMQAATSPVAIFYGITAQIWSERAWAALLRAYEAMSFHGLPVVFVSERPVREGDLARFRAVVLPSVRHAHNEVAHAFAAYASGGGNVWMIGDPAEALAHDEYGRTRGIALRGSAVRAWPETIPPMELRTALLRAFDAVGVQRPVRLIREDGTEP